MSYNIDVNDAALNAVLERLTHLDQGPLTAFLQDVTEGMYSRIKDRFVTSTDPNGTPWKPLAEATYNILANRLSKSNLNKDGRINSKGASKLANKKILIGETGDLFRQFHIVTQNNSSTLFNSMIYAAIQNFGGMTGRRHKVKIPPRAFFPVTKEGQLYPREREIITAQGEEFLRDQITQK